MDGSAVDEAVALLSGGATALLSADLSGLAAAEVARLLREIEVTQRRLAAVDAQVLAEVAQRGVAGEYGQAGVGELLMAMCRVAPGEARARVRRADEVGPRRTVSGEALPPLHPQAAAALGAGEISVGHVEVIGRCLARADRADGFTVADAAVVEKFLVEAARHEHPAALDRDGQVLLARLGYDPAPPDHDRQRCFSLHKQSDGSALARGTLTPEATAAWEAVFDSLAAPVPVADGLPDDRSPAQRRHDALHEAATRLLRSDTLPAAGGVPVTVLVRITESDLSAATGDSTGDPTGERPGRDSTARYGHRGGADNIPSRGPDESSGHSGGTGYGWTGHGGLLPVDRLLHEACEAQIVPVVLDDSGGVLAYGRTRRLASRGQRLALAARDGGCCFPSCDRPAAWAEVHHVIAWIDGGTTDLDNMCLLCAFHHREFARRGWTVRMRHGMPEWKPPAWIDPDQVPIRNTAHHLADHDFSP